MNKILVNFNEYLGGGETLLVRVYEKLNSQGCKVICSKDSFISTKIKTQDCLVYSGDYSFEYISEKCKNELFEWLECNVSNQTTIFVTFCIRDLHIISSYLRISKNSHSRIVHLLLHPLDHLYICQSIVDKLLSKFFNIQRYSLIKNREINKRILQYLNSKESLISMNSNVSARLLQDTNCSIPSKHLIPLPVVDSEILPCKYVVKSPNSKIRIVWLGRIVDFKIPAILAMIDFVNVNRNYEFSIIGYGHEQIIKKYMLKLDLDFDNVRLLGKIDLLSNPNYISEFDIGYGMGTSIVELTRLGLPTIVALASPDFKNFDKPMCAGLVCDQEPGNVGDDLYANNLGSSYSIADTINKILIDPRTIHLKSSEYINHYFNSEVNISRYISVINDFQAHDFSSFDAIKVNIFRKLIFRMVFK